MQRDGLSTALRDCLMKGKTMKNIQFTSVVIGFLLCLVLGVSVAAVGGRVGVEPAGTYQMVEGDKNVIIMNTRTGKFCVREFPWILKPHRVRGWYWADSEAEQDFKIPVKIKQQMDN